MAYIGSYFCIGEKELIDECIKIGEYFKIGETVALVTMIFSLVIIHSICWKRRKFRGIVLAYSLLLLSTIFAILRECKCEYWEVMRELEHASLLISSFIFLYVAYVTHKNLGGS
jgi:hypothetical protein